MPKRNKLPKLPESPDLTGLGREDKTPRDWLVQKTKPLTTLSETNLTLPEFKILDSYLSRINSSNPNKRYVRFEKGELEQLLGVTRILNDDLSKRIDNLFQTVTIRDSTKPNGFIKIALFEKAVCNQDENGQWQVDLACSASSMEYIFNPENLTYLKYRLKNVINLTSRYSYILFLYLLDNRWRKDWSISLAELKQLLNCTAERYSEEFKYFNSEVLKKCQKEINGKTDINFSYAPIKKGRKVTAIQFIVETVSDILVSDKESSDQLSLLDNVPSDPPEQPHEPIDIETVWCNKYNIDYTDDIVFMAAACNFEFSAVQINEIMEFVRLMPLENQYGTDVARNHYISQTYAKLNTAAERAEKNKSPIKHRYNYFLTLVKKDFDKK